MADTTHKAYTQSATSALTTELNSLTNATNSSASSAIDNTSNLDLFIDLELVLATQGTARSAGGGVAVYLVQALDGTNYDDVIYEGAEMLTMFVFDAATTARRGSRRDLAIPPGTFKLFVRNLTGQTLAASGNTLKYRTHSLKSV